MYEVRVRSNGLVIDDLEEFLKKIQEHIKDGVVEVDVEGENKEVITYAVYNDCIKEIINDI